jgi:hypothetical protein
LALLKSSAEQSRSGAPAAFLFQQKRDEGVASTRFGSFSTEPYKRRAFGAKQIQLREKDDSGTLTRQRLPIRGQKLSGINNLDRARFKLKLPF